MDFMYSVCPLGSFQVPEPALLSVIHVVIRRKTGQVPWDPDGKLAPPHTRCYLYCVWNDRRVGGDPSGIRALLDAVGCWRWIFRRGSAAASNARAHALRPTAERPTLSVKKQAPSALPA